MRKKPSLCNISQQIHREKPYKTASKRRGRKRWERTYRTERRHRRGTRTRRAGVKTTPLFCRPWGAIATGKVSKEKAKRKNLRIVSRTFFLNPPPNASGWCVHTCPDKRFVSVRPNATTIPFPWHWSISQSCGGMAILQIFSMLQCMIIHSACFLLPSILSISALHTFEDLAFCPCYNLGSLLLLPASFAFSSGSYRTALYLELSLTCAFDVFCEHLLHFW